MSAVADCCHALGESATSLFFILLGSNAIPMTLNTRHTSLRRSSSLEGLGVRGWEGRWMAHDPSDRTQEGARRHVGSHASPSRPSAAAPQHASRATDCRPLAHAPTWIASLAAAVEGWRSARAAGRPERRPRPSAPPPVVWLRDTLTAAAPCTSAPPARPRLAAAGRRARGAGSRSPRRRALCAAAAAASRHCLRRGQRRGPSRTAC